MHFVAPRRASLCSTSRLMSNRSRFPVPTCYAIDHSVQPENVPRSVRQAAYSIAALESICISESKYIVHSRRKINFSGKTRTLHSISGANLIWNVGHLLQYTPSLRHFLERNSITHLSEALLSNFVSDYSPSFCDRGFLQMETRDLCH